MSVLDNGGLDKDNGVSIKVFDKRALEFSIRQETNLSIRIWNLFIRFLLFDYFDLIAVCYISEPDGRCGGRRKDIVDLQFLFFYLI